MACEQTSSAASNHGQEDSKRIDVMFLCDEWKSCKGGLSTFNREFAVNLAETTRDSINVHCYVAQSDEQSKEDARKHGVNLITARSIPGSSDPLDWLKIPPPELPNPDIVVGHGRKFGTPAYFIVQTTKCKWMHFVHVFCEDLGKFKSTQSAAVDTIEENEKKHKNEIELCKAADVVVAVGSRLQQKYSRSLPNVEVQRITPGILQKFFSESSQLVKDRSVVKTFNVFMFGRASFEDLTLKGYDIVANAIGSLDKMFELTFVGSSPGEHRKIEQWFLDNTDISRNQITIRSYCNAQDELKMMFHQSDMIALPSRTEGFGLVALEAISAGIPVLVAGESGIAEALLKVDSGHSFIVESDDAKVWAQRIQQLSSQSPEERENNAKLLRDNYNKTYQWRSECERFKRMIQDLAKRRNETSEPFPVDSEHPVPDGEQQGSVASAPSNEVESPGVASTGTDNFKEGKPSDLELDDLALQIGAKWKRIGIHLGISNDVLEGIVANTEEKPFQMLLYWRNTTTSATPYHDIYNALCHSGVGLNNLAKEFCLKQSSRSSLKRDLADLSEHHPSAKRSRSAALNIGIGVEEMKPAEHNTQAFRTPASTVKLGGSQNYGHQEASAVPVSSGQTQPSCADAEIPQAPMSSIPTEGQVLRLIAVSYLQGTNPRSREDFDHFLQYMEKMQLAITKVSFGSLLITVKCDSLQILERLWENYLSGDLGEVVQRCFVTEEILTELSLEELKLKTTISEEEYKACKKYLGKDSAIEAGETDDGDDLASNDEEADDGDVSVSDDEEQPIHEENDEESVRDKEDNLQTETVEEELKTGTDEDQCGNVTIPVEQPSRVHFADEENVRDKEDNLQTEIVEEELKTGTDEGSLVSKDEGISYWMSSTFESSSYASLGSSLSTGLTFPFRSWEYDLHEIVTTGLEKFDVGSPKELQDYLTYLAREMDSAGAHYFIFRKKSNSCNVNESVSLVLFFFFDYGLVADRETSLSV